MANRRQFIHTSLALSAASVAPLSFMEQAFMEQVLAAPAGHPVALDAFITDARYAESLAMAASFSQHDVTVHNIDGDVTPLWVGHLSKQWRISPGVLAGSTGRDALFVLETLAWDHGMRVTHREVMVPSGQQTDGGSVPLVSWIIAPAGRTPRSST